MYDESVLTKGSVIGVTLLECISFRNKKRTSKLYQSLFNMIV